MSSGFPPLFKAASFAERPIDVKKISSKRILGPRAEDDIEIEEELQQQHDYRHDHGADHGIGHVDLAQERNGLADAPAHEERDDARR